MRYIMRRDATETIPRSSLKNPSSRGVGGPVAISWASEQCHGIAFPARDALIFVCITLASVLCCHNRFAKDKALIRIWLHNTEGT